MRKRKKVENLETEIRHSPYFEGRFFGLLRFPVFGDSGIKAVAKLKRMAKLRGRGDYLGMMMCLYDCIMAMDEMQIRGVNTIAVREDSK
jgi:hypothetical protein